MAADEAKRDDAGGRNAGIWMFWVSGIWRRIKIPLAVAMPNNASNCSENSHSRRHHKLNCFPSITGVGACLKQPGTTTDANNR